MTVQQLQYVLEVHKVGSITQAAKTLFVVPSRVSSAIHALEEELGYPIFIRGRKGSKLTDQGAWVVLHAQEVCRHLQQIKQGKADAAAQPFRLLAGPYLPLSEVFVKLLEEYGERRKAAFIQRDTVVMEESLDKLVARSDDLAVFVVLSQFAGKLDHQVRKRGLNAKLHKRIPAVIRIGRGHPLYEQKTVDVQELGHHWLVDGPKRGVAGAPFLQGIVGFDPYRVLIQENQQKRYEMTAKGLCFQIGAKLPEYMDKHYGFRNIPIPEVEYQVVSVTDPDVPMREEIKRYLELLDEELNLI